MRKIYTSFLMLLALGTFAQGYEIKITVKNIPDSICYLTKYVWDQQRLVDTAVVKKGTMTFKGNKPLEKGIYSVVRQSQKQMFFDFIVSESQKLTMVTDTMDAYRNMKLTGPKVNQDFVDFVIFMGTKNKDRFDFEKDLKSKKNPDSTRLLNEKTASMFKEIKDYQKTYLQNNPNNYLSTIIRLQTEPEVPEAPLLANGRKDSLFPYYYYKKHYWDGIPLNDIGVLNTNRLFYDRLKRYYEKVLIQIPDSLMRDADWLVEQTTGEKEMFKYMVYYLTYTSESSKIMCMDMVFVYLVNKYYKTGKTFWVEEKQLEKIIKRGNILEPILCNKISPNLQMIDTVGIKTIQRLGMDTISSSEKLTKAYYDNVDAIQKLYKNLYDVKADYTVLLFWDVDCGHCKKEVPIILEKYHKLKSEGKSVEVFAVYTQHEYDKWKKFVRENKLDWMNVADGVHLNNLKDKFDIFSTPVIFILDRNKVIRAKKIGADQVEDIIRGLEREKKMK